MKLKLPVPDHTTLSRRGRTIRPKISVPQSNNQPLHIIVDSTGLSIHGEGPWASGKKKRRGWRKLHISIDSEGRIRSTCLSKWYTQDGQRVPHLLQQIKDLGDRGYDQGSVYNHVLNHSSYIHVQTQLFLIKENGHTETSMFKRYFCMMMAYISGEENRDIINKAKQSGESIFIRLNQIGIRQSLDRNYEQDDGRE